MCNSLSEAVQLYNLINSYLTENGIHEKKPVFHLLLLLMGTIYLLFHILAACRVLEKVFLYCARNKITLP